jgi:hypothetical protein
MDVSYNYIKTDRRKDGQTDKRDKTDRRTNGWIRKGTPEITLEESSYLMEERNGSIGLNTDIDTDIDDDDDDDDDAVGRFNGNIYVG